MGGLSAVLDGPAFPILQGLILTTPPDSRTADAPVGLGDVRQRTSGSRAHRVALVHDYLTQRGGAERVVLSMVRAFPEAPLHTALYRPETTFDDVRAAPVRPFPLNRMPLLRRYHRLALPALARSFSQQTVDADVALCSSSGWAHGVRTTGRKIVYCYTPARWLYDTERYTSQWPAARGAMRWMRGPLQRWDQQAASTADRYLTLSYAVQARIKQVYGIEAEVVSPPTTVNTDGVREAIAGIEPGYYLCVSRLLPSKNVGAIVAAFDRLPSKRLVVAGRGPQHKELEQAAGKNVRFVGAVTEGQLRWLYANCVGVVAAGYEDFGLSPLEAAAFGKPSAVLEWGGFLDTTVPGETGVFFRDADPAEIAKAVAHLDRTHWCELALRRQAARFSEPPFIARLQEVVAEVSTQ